MFLYLVIMFSCLCASIFLYFMCMNQVFMLEWTIFKNLGVDYSVIFMLDDKSSIFSVTVSLITISVLYFSSEYMMNEIYKNRFYLLLLSFVFSMFLLIFSVSILMLMLGWDGLGITSYLLVIFYNNYKSLNSGMITILSNRVGDIFMIMFLGVILLTGTFNVLEYKLNSLEVKYLVLLLIVAATTKSAQIPFMAWLPAAMAAPTPVSALVHSSTLVTAGVYLMVRHSEFLSGVEYYLLVVGSLSCFFSSFSAIFESDLKKMVALSTLSQLGVMMMVLGVGNATLAFAHLIGHAMFKAMLFISTGQMIHLSSGYQDLRFMGNAMFMSIFNAGFVVISMMSLIGLPFMVAFFTKELILELILMKELGLWLLMIAIIAILLTPFYSIRFLQLYFMNMKSMLMLNYSTWNLSLSSISLLILGVPSIFIGKILEAVLLDIKLLNVLGSMINFMMYTMMVLIVMMLFDKLDLYLLVSFKKFYKFLGSLMYLSYISGPIMVYFCISPSQKMYFYMEKSMLPYFLHSFTQSSMEANFSLKSISMKLLDVLYIMGILMASSLLCCVI
nr:NADH dehydrogenase subunit 5 [Lamproglena orientalis]WKB11734.1 NADH dehydrogenase subunit 5 [Lamproglena orientalis]